MCLSQVISLITVSFAEKGSICNVFFTIGTQPNEFIMNFQASEAPDLDSAYIGYDTTSHYVAESDSFIQNYAYTSLANNFKVIYTSSYLPKFTQNIDDVVQ